MILRIIQKSKSPRISLCFLSGGETQSLIPAYSCSAFKAQVFREGFSLPVCLRLTVLQFHSDPKNYPLSCDTHPNPIEELRCFTVHDSIRN